MFRRSRTLMVVVALSVLADAAWGFYVRFCRPSVQSDSLVGQTESQILRHLWVAGPTDWQDYQSLALHVPPTLPQGAIASPSIVSSIQRGLLFAGSRTGATILGRSPLAEVTPQKESG